MKRIAETNAPHPITGWDAHLEIFDAGADTIIRATASPPHQGCSVIIHSGKEPEAVMRESGLFWHVAGADDPEAVCIRAIASAPASSFAELASTGMPKIAGNGTVTVYDDGTGRALLQRREDGDRGMTFTWKSPELSPDAWIAANREGDWTWHGANPPAPPPIVDDEGFTIDPDHVHFEAKKLSIGWAVTYQDAPRTKPIEGGVKKRSSMRWPLLVAADWLEDAEEVCKAAAAILERNKAEMGAK